LLRRPARTALTLLALTTVVVLVFTVVGFVRGLERSLAVSGDPRVTLVYSIGAEENIENSSVSASVPGVLAASLDAVDSAYGERRISPELYFGTRVIAGERQPGMGLVRGVTTTAPLVRRQVRIVEGTWPGPGEALVGTLAAAKLGCDESDLAIGESLQFEGRTWRISGRFQAGGAAFESEVWVRLPDFQQALKRQDLSLVALALKSGRTAGEVQLLCKSRTDLELQATGETAYYAAMQKHYRPVRYLAWTVVFLVSGAGVFAGLNMMYGAVAGRIRELATLQAIGFRRRAIVASLLQESALLSATAALLAGTIALFLLNGVSVRFTMGAFALRIDGVAILVGCGTGLALGLVGALPPAFKALRAPVAQAIKAV
jgi:ABC-type antimicrobial peptide transport system permease subunit